MKIITISREFGSGGRELGKRLSDLLGFDYYDREIISAIAKAEGMSENYVEHILDNHRWQNIALTYRHSFSSCDVMHNTQIKILIQQRKTIEAIAETGRDCIIVGRSADVFLTELKPFSIFVCADKDAKIKRCLDRAEPNENLSPKAIAKNMRRIDKSRASSRAMISDNSWGDPKNYQLTVNTTDWEIKNLAPLVAEFAKSYFEQKQ